MTALDPWFATVGISAPTMPPGDGARLSKEEEVETASGSGSGDGSAGPGKTSMSRVGSLSVAGKGSTQDLS